MKTVPDEQIAGLTVSRETSERLHAFEALVRRWTPVVNLVAKSTVPQLWERHIVDSAQVFSYCPTNARHWVDLGSGGGFPGIVVAILAHELQPGLKVTLVESDARKSTFLRQAAQALNLDLTVHTERAESLPPQTADVVSARALAALPDLLEYVHRHLRRGGVAVLSKGARYLEEIADASQIWTCQIETHPSTSNAESAILIIKDLERARQ
jgi:16S rRNA (guanine527-N7)-methyltransferase